VPVFEIYTGPLERAGGTPREQLKQLFVELEATIRAPEVRGSTFTSASSELADLGHPAHPVIRRHKERPRRWMLTRARAAGAADPGQLARQLMIVFDGAPCSRCCIVPPAQPATRASSRKR
jgi:hypothetical protein